MLPLGSRYPQQFDDDSNLLLAKDSLKVRLSQDYNPGDQRVLAEGPVEKFPPQGIITLIDRCDPEHVTSLYYEKRAGNAFGGLSLTPNSSDTFKSRLSTVIAQQLDALHHNNIKDAILAIQATLGTMKDDGKTLFGRLNVLKRIALAPRAWFEADVTLGLAPLTVNLTSSSTGTRGPVGDIIYTWDFGDGTRSRTGDSSVTKTYLEPGVYAVTLEVTNMYGADKVVLHDLIKARPPAPEEVPVTVIPQPGQVLVAGGVRTTVNQYVVMEAAPNDSTDPVVAYTWQTAQGDARPSGSQNKAIYDSGGVYDISVRADTKLGAFRISSFPGMVDVIEATNLWLWTSQSPKIVNAHEYGLVSETFKVKNYAGLAIGTDDSFLNGVPNERLQKEEFRFNNLFLNRSETPSGFQGEGAIIWASGRSPEASPLLEQVSACFFNAFLDTYSQPHKAAARPWNWAGFAAPTARAFLIGGSVPGDQNPGASLANDTKLVIDFKAMESSETKLHQHNFLSGAHDLRRHLTGFDGTGRPLFGHFSRYRTTWVGDVGYMVRSGGPEDDYRFKSFYKTDGTIAEPFINITKLLDLPEPKAEGQLLNLNNSVYFLSGGGDVFAYSEDTNTWEIGAAQGVMFHGIDTAGKFLATSDKDRRAYISFGNDAFVKYNALEMTFTSLGQRPSGDQWLVSVF